MSIHPSVAVTALAALGEESRLAIFRLLATGGRTGMNVGAIGDRVSIPQPRVSYHLKKLANVGLVASRREGKFVIYSVNIGIVSDVFGFLTNSVSQRESA